MSTLYECKNCGSQMRAPVGQLWVCDDDCREELEFKEEVKRDEEKEIEDEIMADQE